MQKFYRASLTFKLQKTAKKPLFGIKVINALSAILAKGKFSNSNSLDLPVPLKELQAINDSLAAAFSAAMLAKNQLELKVATIQWDAAFTLTANYITSIAKGSESFISSTGFVPTKNETVTVPKVPVTSKFKAAVHGYAYSVS
ncbi:MAG: hypothetical protein JO072_15035 [Parafilimonas sp.]|nr:hypothetical protein [Parafilimonas sp.]